MTTDLRYAPMADAERNLVRSVGEAVEAGRRKDAACVAARRAGMPITEVARIAGYSRQHVYDLIREADERERSGETT